MNKVWNFVKGFKTVFVFGILWLVGLLDVLGQIDLTQILVTFGVPVEKAGGIVTLISSLAIVLRFLTNTPVGKKE